MRNEPITRPSPPREMTRDYDSRDSLKRQEDFHGYDNLNRLRTVTELVDGGDDRITHYTYNPVGNLKTVTYPNGTSTEYFYDRLNRLTPVENVDYTYDNVGNRLTMQVREGGEGVQITHEYDPNDRLTRAARHGRAVAAAPTGGDEHYASAPSRPSPWAGHALKGLGLVSLCALFVPPLLTRPGARRLGGRVRLGGRARRRRVCNGIVAVFLALLMLIGPENVYALHAESMLYQSLADKNRPYAQVLQERLKVGAADPVLQARYTYGLDLISQAWGQTSPVVSYYHYDGQTSTRQLTGPAGSITDTYTYDAFGNLDPAASSPSANKPYRYTGEQYDAHAGSYYLRARYYTPTTGRFTTRDPLTGVRTHPTSLHRYLYANADPVAKLDPSGLSTCGSLCDPMAVIECDNPFTRLDIPPNRANPGFIGGGVTKGGARECVLPHLRIDQLKKVTIRTVE